MSETEELKTEKLDPNMHRYLKGYWEALNDFGIWKDGTQHIGCLETPINEAMMQKMVRNKIPLVHFKLLKG